MINKLSPIPVFGFETEQRIEVARRQHAGNKRALNALNEDWVRYNIGKVISVIPGINFIAGIALVVLGIMIPEINPTTKESQSEAKKQLILRGIATFFTGPLVLIVDVIQTLRERALIQEFNSPTEGLLNG